MIKTSFKSAAVLLLAAAGGAFAQTFPTTTNPRVVLSTVPNTSYPVMGVGFLSDGRMVVLGAAINTSPGNGAMGQGYITPADSNQAVYLVSGLSAKGALSAVTVTKILDSLTGAPPGVLVVNDTIYVQDRHAFYRIKSHSPAVGATSKNVNATRLVNVPTLDDSTFSWNRGESGHQYVFTPQYHNGRFYGAYGGSIIPGGWSGAAPTSTYSGAMLSWGKSVVPTGTPNAGLSKEAGGLRSPNGLATNGQYMIYTDNQGSFNPANPIHFFRPGQPLVTYGTRQSTSANAAGAATNQINGNTKRNWAEDLPYQPPLIWVPYTNGPSRSLTQPLYLDHGPYKGHWIMGDATISGMGRLFVDDVDNSGKYQGSFTFFTSGINTSGGTSSGKAINRLAASPDSAVYVGTVLNIGNWPAGTAGPMSRLSFRDTSVFEIISVRSRKSADGTQNGVEVFFSEPVNPTTITTSAFSLQQLNYVLGANYGCNATVCTTRNPTVSSVTLSTDNRKVFVAIATPDTSIGAAHIGVLGTGNNPTGIWGGPGKQDRTLRLTLNSVTSATGSALLHNWAWMGWHFQATTRFDPANTETRPVPVLSRPVDRLAAAVNIRAFGGVLDVQLASPGQATVSLYTLNGSLIAQQSGSTGLFLIETNALGKGLHVLRIQQGKTVVSRRVTL